MNNYREHYTPETPILAHMNLADMVLIWLSGVAVGLAVGLIVTGN